MILFGRLLHPIFSQTCIPEKTRGESDGEYSNGGGTFKSEWKGPGAIA